MNIGVARDRDTVLDTVGFMVLPGGNQGFASKAAMHGVRLYMRDESGKIVADALLSRDEALKVAEAMIECAQDG